MQRKNFLIQWLLPFIVLCAFIIIGSYIWGYLQKPTTLPFNKISVVNTSQYVDTKLINHVVAQNLDGGFFSLDIKRLQLSLQQLPWISSVAIRKVWPDKLNVIIVPEQPVACWNDSGVIDQYGQLFFPPKSTIPADLPRLNGPSDAVNDVYSLFQLVRTDLSLINLKVTMLSLSERRSWKLRLNNGVTVVLGRAAVQQRIKEFVQLYPKVVMGKEARIDSVDLRYPDGVAIKWKIKD